MLLIAAYFLLVLRRDLLHAKYDGIGGGPYDPEMYRIPMENKKYPLRDIDVTDQLLNSPLDLGVPG